MPSERGRMLKQQIVSKDAVPPSCFTDREIASQRRLAVCPRSQSILVSEPQLYSDPRPPLYGWPERCWPGTASHTELDSSSETALLSSVTLGNLFNLFDSPFFPSGDGYDNIAAAAAEDDDNYSINKRNGFLFLAESSDKANHKDCDAKYYSINAIHVIILPS